MTALADAQLIHVGIFFHENRVARIESALQSKER